MTDELSPRLLYKDVTVDTRAISGGALRISASIIFRAEMDIPAEARQFGDELEERRRQLREVCQQRLYGGVRMDAAAVLAQLVGILRPIDGMTDEIGEEIVALFDPLLNAGRELVWPLEPNNR